MLEVWRFISSFMCYMNKTEAILTPMHFTIKWKHFCKQWWKDTSLLRVKLQEPMYNEK